MIVIDNPSQEVVKYSCDSKRMNINRKEVRLKELVKGEVLVQKDGCDPSQSSYGYDARGLR